MPRVKSFKEAGKLVSKVVKVKTRNFLLDTWTDLVNTTPVLTGKARYSWKISPGKPYTKEIPDGQYSYPPLPNLDRYKKNWKKWYIANTAPYIEDLNAGSSTKAPAGFVQTAIQKNIVKHG